MTRLTRAWHAFLADPGSTPQAADLHAMNGVQAFVQEPPNLSAQPTLTATALNLRTLQTQVPLSSCSTCPFSASPLPATAIDGPVGTPSSIEPTALDLKSNETLDLGTAHDRSTSREHVEAAKTHIDELAAVAKVLQLLEHQLSGVNKDVEESVAGVCAGYSGISRRAQEAVSSARSATVGDAQCSNASKPLEEMQHVLEALLVAVQASCGFSQSATDKLSQLEKRLGGVEKNVAEVEDIAGRAKMVALNGRIEASRLGIAGKAFGVVAQETKELADKAGKTGCSIRESINALAKELFEAAAEMRRRADSDAARFQKTNSEVRQLLTKLEQTHRQMNLAMATTANISIELQSDIGRAVMSMQFQDRVSQRVSHIVDAIEGLVQRIQPWCAEANLSETQKYFDAWQAEMESRYTMDSERHAGPEVGLLHTPLKATYNSSVELF